MRIIDDIRRDDAAGYPQVGAGHAPLFSDIRVLLAEVDRLEKEVQKKGLPFEAEAIARFYTTEIEQEFWSCLACGCEWPHDVVTACANCHGPKETK